MQEGLGACGHPDLRMSAERGSRRSYLTVDVVYGSRAMFLARLIATVSNR